MDDEASRIRYSDRPDVVEPSMSSPATANDLLAANKRVLLRAYVVLGLLSTLAYLSQVNVSFVAIAGSRSGLGVILIALPAIVPYILAGGYAWQLISERRLGLYLFLIATLIGTIAASLVITGTIFDVRMSVTTIFWYALAQTAAYGLAAEFLLRIEWP